MMWLRALRAPFLTASGLPVLLGAFAAYWKTGSLSAARLLLTLGGVLCIHIGSNLANDFFDHVTGCDRLNLEPTPFSGGSRVIQQGLISPKTVMAVSIVFFAAGLAQGLVLNRLVPGNTVILLGLVGLVLGLVYTAVPVKLSYRGLGETAVFLAFGPLVVVGSFTCQTGAIEAFPLAASLPAGLLVASILLANEVLDIEWDDRAGKRTLVVALGRRRAYLVFLVTYLGAYVWIALGLLLRVYPTAAIAALGPLPVVIRYLLPGRALRDRRALIRASSLAIASNAVVIGLLAVSYLVDG